MQHFLSYNVIFEFVLINWERNRTLLGRICTKKAQVTTLVWFLTLYGTIDQVMYGSRIKVLDQEAQTRNIHYFCYSTEQDCWSCCRQWNASTRIFVCLFLFNFLSLQQTITTSPRNTFRMEICSLAHNISTIWLKGLKISWCLNQIWGKFGLSSMIGKFNFAKYFITQRLLWEGMTQQKEPTQKNF